VRPRHKTAFKTPPGADRSEHRIISKLAVVV